MNHFWQLRIADCGLRTRASQRRGDAECQDEEVDLTVAQVALQHGEEEREEDGEEHGAGRSGREAIGASGEQHRARGPAHGGCADREPDDDRNDRGGQRQRNQQERERCGIQIRERRRQQVRAAAVQQRPRGQEIAGEVDAAGPLRTRNRLHEQHPAEDSHPCPRDRGLRPGARLSSNWR
jgi:hypothetical protein